MGKKGEVVNVPDKVAALWVGAGYAKEPAEEPAKKTKK